MAHYDPHRNQGYDGYAIKEPAYGGRQMAVVVGYSATSESYMSSTEEVITYGGYPTRPDLHDQVWTRFQPKIGEEYNHSPKLSHGKGSPHNSPRMTTLSSSPTGHHSSKYGPHLVSSHDRPHSPKFNHANNSPRDSPRKTTLHEKSFRDDNRGGFRSNDNDSSDDKDDVERRDGVFHPEPTVGRGGHVDYGKDKKKGSNYAAGNYPLHLSADNQLHHQAADGHRYSNTEKLPQGNNMYGSNSTDAYYDDYTRSKTGPYAVPARLDPRDGGKYRGENGKSSPVSAPAQWTPFASSPRKGAHEGKAEMMESKEAQRQYENSPPHMERMYGTAIDCETAARKYGGVFVKV